MRNPSLPSSKQREVGGRGGRGSVCSGKKAAEATLSCSKMGLKRGPWTVEEDELLAKYIKREGEGRWRTLPSKAGLLRCGKSCRLRWMNYLRPSVKRGHISADEEDLILRLHRLLGNRWSLIAGRIPGRTDNEIKNYWNTHLSKKLISQGIDPKTHKPLAASSNPNPSINSHNHNNLEADVNPSTEAAAVKEDSTTGVVHDRHHARKDDLVQKNCSDNIDQGMFVSDVENGDDVKDDDDDDEMRKNYVDDAFSSFLNSLINDDMFNNQQNEQDHQESN